MSNSPSLVQLAVCLWKKVASIQLYLYNHLGASCIVSHANYTHPDQEQASTSNNIIQFITGPGQESPPRVSKMVEKEQITSPSNVTVGSGDVRDVKQAPRGRDIAAELTEQFADEPGFDREEETRLRWKIDRRLIPILFLNITLPAMDKITPSTGALYGMRQDLNLKGDEYSWIGSSFYVSPCLDVRHDSLTAPSSLATCSGVSPHLRFFSVFPLPNPYLVPCSPGDLSSSVLASARASSPWSSRESYLVPSRLLLRQAISSS